MAEKTGARLRQIRARRNEITDEIADHRARITAMKTAGEGGPERRALKSKLKELKAEREQLKEEAAALKAS